MEKETFRNPANRFGGHSPNRISAPSDTRSYNDAVIHGFNDFMTQCRHSSAIRIPASPQNRIRDDLPVRHFHEMFFTLSPEKSAIEHNVSRALLLADRSVYNSYSDFAEKGYYNRVITGNINQVLKVDSVVCDFNRSPYRATTYATQRIIRQSNVTVRSL